MHWRWHQLANPLFCFLYPCLLQHIDSEYKDRLQLAQFKAAEPVTREKEMSVRARGDPYMCKH